MSIKFNQFSDAKITIKCFITASYEKRKLLKWSF